MTNQKDEFLFLKPDIDPITDVSLLCDVHVQQSCLSEAYHRPLYLFFSLIYEGFEKV